MSTTTVELIDLRRHREPGPLARRAVALVGGIALFVLALALVKRGAGGLLPALGVLHVSGVRGALGFGWLMALGVLSGSPVAAIALALLAGGSLAPQESLAMIVGSRLGAAFVVLLVGGLDDLRARRGELRSVSVGVMALVTTALTYIPAAGLGLHGLRAGWLLGLRIDASRLGPVSALFEAVMSAAGGRLPSGLVFAIGVVTLLAAFRVFDAALPGACGQRLAAGQHRLERPAAMFAAGLVVTAVTMSVSMSLSLLVPLTARGHLRRERLWLFVLGANITTLDDTLFAAALVGHPEAVRIVALLIAAVTLVSAPIVLLCPTGFGGLVETITRRVTRGPASLAGFVALLVLVPAALLAF